MRTISSFLALLIGAVVAAPALAGSAGALRFSAGNYQIGEAGGQITITVERGVGVSGEVSVNYATSDGTAVAGDYVPTSGTLTWPDGDATTRSFIVSITDDTIEEQTQSLNLALSAPTNGATLASPNTATLQINDNDLPTVVTGVGTVAATRAATLLLPHFQVATGNATGVGTAMTVGNSAAASQLVHLTLWTDRGVPTRSFDLRLPANGATEVDLRALFTTGTLPAGTVTTANCQAVNPAPITLPAADVAALRNAHTGQSSDLLDGMCGGAPFGDGIARGYATIDAVVDCSTVFPGDGNYFGTIASDANVLWGEYSMHVPATNSAYGDTLVHLEASTTDSDTDGTPSEVASGLQPPNATLSLADYTFYGRRIGASGADHREGLPPVWMGQFSLADVVPRTTAIAWRDPGRVAPFACNSPPAGIAQREVVAFDQRENPASDEQIVTLPLASQAVRLDDPGRSAVPFEKGVLRYQLALSGADPLFAGRNQAHVSHLYESSFGGAGLSRTWPMERISDIFQFELNPPGPPVPPQCSDGNDNDGDGASDFPADADCTSPGDPVEAPGRCSDGVDNDGDGLIDFPADTACRSPEQEFENEQVCSNGFDDDGDGSTDFPDDTGCASPFANSERPDCSDGNDNDGDGQVDFPADAQCASAFDLTESQITQCQDGIDNDGDGQTDYPADLQCESEYEDLEARALCSDGVDNDGDGLTDFPADLGCTSALDSDEQNAACMDGIDNDGDTLIDFPADLGCTSATDFSETNPQCVDGIDNDGDGFTDFPADIGCSDANDSSEANAQCSDGIDNDSDGFTDFPADIGCSSATDNSEPNPPHCSDGIDNDGDGLIDFPQESGCSQPSDAFEGPDCSAGDAVPTGNPMNPLDAIDNDLDGLANFGQDPGCASESDLNELAGTLTRACSDGVDNDGDGGIDFPADAGCSSAWDDVEFVLGVKSPAIDVLPDTLPSGSAGVPYSQALSATGGVAPHTFAVTAGALPPGLALTPNGLLSGTPTAGGSYSFTVTATDDNGFTGTQVYTLGIGVPTILLQPAGPALPGARRGIAYAQTFTASGGTTPYTFAVSAGSLPPGLTLSASGQLSGTPSGTGSFNFTIRATDANGFTGSAVYTLGVVAPAQPPTLVPATSPFTLLLFGLLVLGLAGWSTRRGG